MKLLLVPLDDSPRAPNVLRTALHLGTRTGAKLRLLRVVMLPPEVPTELLGVSTESFLEVLVSEAKKSLARLAEQVPAERLDGADVVVGAAWRAICEEAKHKKADLIVIGSHGYHGLDRLLGTTAAKVVNHAPCSVLVARELAV